MRSSVLLLLGLALAMGCDQPAPLAPADTGPALVKHQITHLDETSGTFELRGLTGCFGELVVATGTVRFKEHTMTDLATGNDDHFSLTFILNGTAVGQRTGRVWKFKDMTKIRFNTPNLPAPHATEIRTTNTHLVGPGGSVKLQLKFHGVITRKGGVKIVLDSAKGACNPSE